MLKQGNFVKLKNSSLYGYVTKITKDKNNIICHININDKIVIVNENNLIITDNLNNTRKLKNSDYNLKVDKNTNDTIMLRHQTVDEALSNLDKFIDNAICNNLSQIKIIHGKNGGILRREVHKYLSNHPAIKEHRLGGYYEGSYGVTIAFLK